jgi:uncharacterized LabA/DUF88 family protein
MTSDSLINVSDRYVDLDQIKEEIQKVSKTSLSYGGFPTIGILDHDKTR